MKFEGPDRRMQDSPMYQGKNESLEALDRSLDEEGVPLVHPVLRAATEGDGAPV